MKTFKTKRFTMIELIIGVIVSAVLFGFGGAAVVNISDSIGNLEVGVLENNNDLEEALNLLNNDELYGNLDPNADIEVILNDALAQTISDTGADQEAVELMRKDLENAILEITKKYEEGYYNKK